MLKTVKFGKHIQFIFISRPGWLDKGVKPHFGHKINRSHWHSFFLGPLCIEAFTKVNA